MNMRSYRFLFALLVLAGLLVVVLALLGGLFEKKLFENVPEWFVYIPFWNGGINAITAIVLLLAFRAIRSKNVKLHSRLMIFALFLTLVFLISYLSYHFSGISIGFEPPPGMGWLRVIYLVMLVTHIIAAAIVAPMVLIVVYMALTGNFSKHVRLARKVFPLWMYTVLSGVLISVFLFFEFVGLV